MIDLRKFAKGQPCMVRTPLWCNHNPETTVLAHYRMAGYSGMGLKCPDILAAFACSDCHDLIDGRRGSWEEFSRSLRLLLHLEGVMRTQAYLIEQGVLILSGEGPHCSTCSCGMELRTEAQRLTTTTGE